VNFISSGFERLKADFKTMLSDIGALVPRGWEERRERALRGEVEYG